MNVMLSDTVLRRVVETGKAVLTADAIIDERFSAAESIVAQGIRSAMAVPLTVNGTIKAVLFLDSRQRINAFSENDLTILTGIAAQAGIALENAALAEQIRAEAITRAELSRFLSKAVADAVIKGETEDLAQSKMAEVTLPVRGHPRLHHAGGERVSAGGGGDAQRVLHRHGQRGVPPRGQPGQVHRRLRDGRVGPSADPPGRSGARAAGGAGDDGRGGRAEREAQVPGQEAHRGGHRHQHRPGRRGLHGQRGAPRVHRHRRHGEHGLAPVRPGQVR